MVLGTPVRRGRSRGRSINNSSDAPMAASHDRGYSDAGTYSGINGGGGASPTSRNRNQQEQQLAATKQTLLSRLRSRSRSKSRGRGGYGGVGGGGIEGGGYQGVLGGELDGIRAVRLTDDDNDNDNDNDYVSTGEFIEVEATADIGNGGEDDISALDNDDHDAMMERVAQSQSQQANSASAAAAAATPTISNGGSGSPSRKSRWPNLRGRSRSRSKSRSKSRTRANESSFDPYGSIGLEGKNKTGKTKTKSKSKGRSKSREKSRTKTKTNSKAKISGSSGVEEMARQAAALAEAQALARQSAWEPNDDGTWETNADHQDDPAIRQLVTMDDDGADGDDNAATAMSDGLKVGDDDDWAAASGHLTFSSSGGSRQRSRSRSRSLSLGRSRSAATSSTSHQSQLTEQERMGLDHLVRRTRSREDVKQQGSALEQAMARAQDVERFRRTREFGGRESGSGGEGYGSEYDSVDAEDTNLDTANDELVGMVRTGGGNPLSHAARRAADAAASLTNANANSNGGGARGVHFLSPTDNGTDAPSSVWDVDKDVADSQERAIVRAVLSRPPHKRETLPPLLARRYAVTVGPAAYHAPSRTYRYQVIVARNVSAAQARTALLPPAQTARSLPDFLFLDTYLRTEFAGAALPPLLSVALYGRELLQVKGEGSGDDSTVASATTFGTLQQPEPVRTVSDLARRCQDRLGQDMDANVPVEENKLAAWLGDVLNGVRGEGEWLLGPHSPASAAAAARGTGPIDVATSEALEAFLYRNTDSLPAPPMDGGMSMGGPHSGAGGGGAAASCLVLAMDQANDAAGGGSSSKRRNLSHIGAALLAAPMACLDQRCNGQFDDMHNRMAVNTSSNGGGGGGGGIVSGGPGSPQKASSSRIVQSLTFQSPLLTAQRDILTTYRRNATKTLHRMKILRDDEVRMATAWKRFAISLSNLFAFEKDLENARVGKQSKIARMEQQKTKPYRKITKNLIDDHLRVVAKHKVERSSPGLDVVGDMMANLLADLAAVDPCLVDYARATSAVDGTVQKLFNTAGCASGDGGAKWKEGSVKALGALKTAATTLANKAGQQPPPPPSAGNSPLSASSTQKAERLRLQHHGKVLEGSLLSLVDSTHIRAARTASRYLRTEAGRAANLRAGVTTLSAKLQVSESQQAEMKERSRRQAAEDRNDDVLELGIVREMFEVVQQSSGVAEGDDDTIADEMRQGHEEMCSRALLLASERVGRWNGELALALMECSGVGDAEVRVEETTRDLRLVRKYAIGLRENVDRCADAVGMLNGVILGASTAGGDDQSLDNSLQSSHSNVSSSMSYEAMKINRKRELFLSSLARSMSGTPVLAGSDEGQRTKAVKAAQVLEQAGVDFSDPAGWLAATEIIETGSEHQYRPGKCGELLVSYQQVRDAEVAVLLARTNQLLADYHKRLEMIESFVYMHCVGIQLEKHYSQMRSEALAMFEEKTNITTAINVAMKRNLPGLVEELQGKLNSLPSNISHTFVKQAKERHLISKNIREDLQKLAERRFQRAKETSTERVIAMIRMWADHEERVTNGELKALGDLINEIERHISRSIIEGDGGAGLLAVATARREV